MKSGEQNKKIGITEQKQWDVKWQDIFDHYQKDKRHAYYINAYLDDSDKQVLEIAAGSFRDCAELNNLGVNCYGTDYSEKAVELAQKQHNSIKDKIFQSDAFNISNVRDKDFDTTFHNGFWILFEDNASILRLLNEQKRITKRKLIATVHNAHNQQLIDYFAMMSEKDPLYKIRFFYLEEMMEIMQNASKNVKIVPVGKFKKLHEDDLINQGKTGRENLRLHFESVGLSHLEISERLMCIAYL